MSNYKKLVVHRYSKTTPKLTAEDRYWKKFTLPVLVKHYAAVTHIEFSPEAPYDFAVTSSTRVQIYNSRTNAVTRTISRFKDVAYSGSFRSDSRLLVAGGETGHVLVFDVNSRTMLRQYKGHSSGVHMTHFTTDRLRVVSGSDDTTVRLWDLSSDKPLSVLKGHGDAVRCGSGSGAGHDVWLTGSYDHTVKLWDLRTGEASMTMDHGAPVESILVFPSGSLVLSAGANYIKIWDILRGGTLLGTVANHQKTITCLAFDGTHSRVLSGGLDHLVKIYDVESYKVTHSIKYQAPVLSVAVSPNSTHLVAGMANGLMSIRQRTSNPAETAQHKSERARAGSYRYFIRGKDAVSVPSDYVVEVKRKKRLRDYDVFLKKFQYRAALDAVLTNQRPIVVVSLLSELKHRDGLKIALSGRDETTLEPILTFVVRRISDPRFSVLLIDVANILFDLYSGVIGKSVVVDELFVSMRRNIQAELNFQKQALRMQGLLEVLMATSASAKQTTLYTEDVAVVANSDDLGDIEATQPQEQAEEEAMGSSDDEDV